MTSYFDTFRPHLFPYQWSARLMQFMTTRRQRMGKLYLDGGILGSGDSHTAASVYSVKSLEIASTLTSGGENLRVSWNSLCCERPDTPTWDDGAERWIGGFAGWVVFWLEENPWICRLLQ